MVEVSIFRRLGKPLKGKKHQDYKIENIWFILVSGQMVAVDDKWNQLSSRRFFWHLCNLQTSFFLLAWPTFGSSADTKMSRLGCFWMYAVIDWVLRMKYKKAPWQTSFCCPACVQFGPRNPWPYCAFSSCVWWKVKFPSSRNCIEIRSIPWLRCMY